MMQEKLTDFIHASLVKNWNIQAMTNYQADSVTFGDIAEKIVGLHTLFEICQVKPGDKVALVGKNSINWAISYLATVSYGAVIVPILPDFKPNDIHHIVNHSDSTLLIAADNIYENLDGAKMPDIKYCFSLTDFTLQSSCKQKKVARSLGNINKLIKEKYPEGINASTLKFTQTENDKLAVLSYTSGTTGFTKGVMLTHNNLVANIVYANHNMPLEPGDKIVSFLPLAHAYGCAFEFLWPFTLGGHITFLTKTPSPQIILKAFKEVRPRLVLAVPLILEKIYKKQIMPALNKPAIKLMLKIPGLSSIVENKIKNTLINAFGGNFQEIVIGGAPLSKDVEELLHRIKFPFSIGYGMTECAPLISYASWDKTRLGSAGKVVDTLELKINSPDPYSIAGEIMVRGENVMQGYYKNAEVTQATIEPDGWMHTGDLGRIDKDGFVFINGRSKSMILGPSGQNIYPEEIEAKYNNMECVQEALIIEQNGKLVALVYPDYETADKKGLNRKQLENLFELHRKTLNDVMPAFMSVASTRLFEEEFEKTPKKSIKRYLYSQ